MAKIVYNFGHSECDRVKKLTLLYLDQVKFYFNISWLRVKEIGN